MATFKEFSGLRNEGAAERYGPGDLAQADNVDIDSTGRLSRRVGRRRVAAGDFHSLWSAGDVCLMAGGDALVRVHPGYSLEVLRTGLALNAPLSCCAVNDRVYWSNGLQTGVVEGGHCRAWGLAAPTRQPTAQGYPGGRLPEGRYQYAVTYLRADGQESGTGLAGVVDVPAGGAIIFTDVPRPDDADVAATLLYLSEPNGTVLYEAEALLPSETIVTLRAPVQADLPLVTPFISAPPPGQLVAYHRGRVYVAAGDTLYWSEPHAYEHFDLRNYVQLPGPITLIAPLDDPKGGIAIATDAVTGWITGDTPEAFAFVKKGDFGAVPGTLAYVPGSQLGEGKLGERAIPLWMSSRGLVAATPEGEFVQITEGRYREAFAGRGAALYLPGPSRYLAVLNR